MKLSEFETLTYKELSKMSVDSLRKLAREQAGKLNKRIDRISGSSKTSKIAVRQAKESGGRFGVSRIQKEKQAAQKSGKSYDEKSALIGEIKREQRFQKAKSGTVRGAKKQKVEIEKATGITSREYAKEKAQRYKKEEEEKKKQENQKRREKAKKAKKSGKKSKRVKPETGRLTKAQKKAIDRAVKKIQKEAEKEYNKALGQAWTSFKEYKEAHPNESYSKEQIKSIVNEYAINGADNSVGIDDYLFERDMEKIFSGSDQKQETNNVWTTVDKLKPLK